jgi:hypothetical protein
MDNLRFDQEIALLRELMLQRVREHNIKKSTEHFRRKDNDLCYSCGLKDHYDKSCPALEQSVIPPLPLSICAKCGDDHIRMMCTQENNKYKYCGGCGERNKERQCCQEGNKYCYKCGNNAHRDQCSPSMYG